MNKIVRGGLSRCYVLSARGGIFDQHLWRENQMHHKTRVWAHNCQRAFSSTFSQPAYDKKNDYYDILGVS
mgnify:CR=1 FL=1